MRGALRMLPDPDWKAEDQPGVRARTSGGSKDKDNDDNQGGDIPAWMFRRSNQKTEKSAPKERDSKKKPAQPKENDDHARRNVKVKEMEMGVVRPSTSLTHRHREEEGWF